MKVDLFLLFYETRNVLQLPVFFFFFIFCQPYPGLWNCMSVFLALWRIEAVSSFSKISMYELI